ncbi:OLC1v1020460C1 [Oldenlandia corymbosa var. corymbosa]|uniref:OLC1v1020460C1 n=1 Tax=Oldenlandia corymbosa var. corymbosa TaxID=529605 RepID=A0AAV1EGK9_OLDCO|nr:OLC1v1020460C1 [Oldenlandia corymbosa var. corymbosa]
MSGYMRQRHNQGYGDASSSSDDDGDECSRPDFSTPPKPGTWVEFLLNFLWIASAVFMIYLGDGDSNFVFLLWHDEERIKRLPLYFGMIGVGLITLFFLYATIMVACGARKTNQNWEILSVAALLPILIVIGITTFCFFTFALWPIWSFLTLPLVFTLFMSGTVILPYLVIRTFKRQLNVEQPNSIL